MASVDPRRRIVGKALRDAGYEIVMQYKDPRSFGCRYKIVVCFRGSKLTKLIHERLPAIELTTEQDTEINKIMSKHVPECYIHSGGVGVWKVSYAWDWEYTKW